MGVFPWFWSEKKNIYIFSDNIGLIFMLLNQLNKGNWVSKWSKLTNCKFNLKQLSQASRIKSFSIVSFLYPFKSESSFHFNYHFFTSIHYISLDIWSLIIIFPKDNIIQICITCNQVEGAISWVAVERYYNLQATSLNSNAYLSYKPTQ